MVLSPSTAAHLLTVVIASRCNDARSDLLRRACQSVRAMAGDLDYSITIVANGASVSSQVLDWLATQPDIRVIRLRSGSYPLARRVGAEFADSEFLAFLDDDDELLPNTLERKIAHFRQHPEIDVLVTDGLRVSGSTVSKIFPPPEARSADLVETMMHAGWGAGALTVRLQDIDLSTFDAEFRDLEWTLTTLQLAKRYRFGYMDEPTYRYYEDTPDSLWKNAQHCFAALEVWRKLSKIYAGTPYETTVRRRFGHACHVASSELVCQGRITAGWRLHFRSLTCPGGLARVSYTARLLLGSLQRLFVGDDAGKRVAAGPKNLGHALGRQKGPGGGPVR